MKKVKKVLRNIGLELEKVRWSTKKEMVTFSAAVISFILIFAFFFYGTDVLIAFAKNLLERGN